CSKVRPLRDRVRGHNGKGIKAVRVAECLWAVTAKMSLGCVSNQVMPLTRNGSVGIARYCHVCLIGRSKVGGNYGVQNAKIITGTVNSSTDAGGKFTAHDNVARKCRIDHVDRNHACPNPSSDSSPTYNIHGHAIYCTGSSRSEEH